MYSHSPRIVHHFSSFLQGGGDEFKQIFGTELKLSEERKFFSHLRAKPPMFANILIDSKSKRITPQKKKSAFPAHTLDGSCYSI